MGDLEGARFDPFGLEGAGDRLDRLRPAGDHDVLGPLRVAMETSARCGSTAARTRSSLVMMATIRPSFGGRP